MRAKWRECQLAYDPHYRGKKACRGSIETIAGVKLCQRHRDLLEAIRRDAELREKGRAA